ncbi:MAG TPA: GNAT family N-acetyltransferase [Candidatus Eisenbacteria bacterium]|nr:GNAT family N-acetyltransferase [Candidatus Eisenbacteria bacterium]
MSPIPEAWRTERARIASVRSVEAPELAAVFRACADVASLDPTFEPVETAEILALVEESERDRGAARGFRMQSIRLQGDDEVIGYYHLREDVPRPGVVALTIFLLRPEFRRGGYGREVAGALLGHLRADTANRAAWARVFLENRRALAFWTALGFRSIVEHKGATVHETGEGRASIILEADFAKDLSPTEGARLP